MDRIDRENAARWAEEARRRAEEAARARTQAPAAPPPVVESARAARPALEDTLERAPRLFGREIVVDGPAAEPRIDAPVPDATPDIPARDLPQAPRTDVLPRLSPSTPRARLDADFDRQQLLGAFGPVSVASLVATADSGALIAKAGRALVGVKKLDWSEAAPALLGSKLRAIAEKAGSLEARAILVKEALSAVETRHAATLVGFKKAGGFLEKAAFKAGVARELSKLAGGAAGSLERMVAARQELVGVRLNAVEAEATLRDLAANAPQTPWALQEVRAIQQTAGMVWTELSQTESHGQMLAAMDAGAGLLAEEPAPEAGAESELTEEDLARIGTGLDPNKPPVQTSWSEQMVNTVCELGRQQGGVTDEQGGRNFELAKVVLGSAEGQTGARALEAVDLAAVLKMAGVDLAKVDPSQLQSAARYVSGALSLEDQQQKLRKAIDSFQVLEKIGLPKLSRQQMVDQLWGVAKVPGHALSKLSDAEVSKKFQEVLAAVNGGPGKSEIKIGKHNLKLEVGQNGAVAKSSCKKPGFFSKVWGVVKKVAPLALTVLSFTPLAPFALAAQGAISLVQAIKAKSLLGIATAAASLVGGAGAVVGKLAGAASKVATTAGKIAKIANSASRGLQGVSSLKSGNILGGLASIGSGIASGISSFATSATKGLGKFSNSLNKVSTKLSAVGTGVASFEAYKKASQAVSEAKEALQAAQASGDARAIAAAQKQLSQAETQKRAALIGGTAGAATAASALVGSRGLFPGKSKAESPAQSRLESNLQLVSRGLGVAQGVVEKDYAGAAVAGLSLGATVNSAQRGGKENRLNDAANLAQAGLGYYQAEKGRTAANQAVSDAQRRLEAARRGGNPEVIQQAEADLKKAKGAAESALMGGIAAGESLLGTAKDIGERHRAEKKAPEGAQKALSEEELKALKSTEDGKKTKERLADVVNDAEAPVAVREAALAEHQKLRKADEDLQKAAVAAAGGDPEKIKTAREAYDKVRHAAESRLPELKRAAESGSPKQASSASTEADETPGLASMRRPQRIAAAKMTKGVTVWEISQRTGVPVERILEFNAQSGNPLDPKNLQIGQQILVPMDAEDIKFKALSAEQVRDLKLKAIAEKKAKESITVPSVRSSDQPAPPSDDLRSKSLHLLANDRALIDEGIKSAELKLTDPTTWVDTKQEKARTQAREAFKQSVDQLESVLTDPKSTEAQIRAALVDKQTALNLYASARHAAHESNEGTNYITPVAEVYKAVVADPFHEQTQKMVAAIDQSSLPDVVKGAAKLPLEIIDKEVSFDFKGAIQTGQDALHAVTKPVIQAIENSGAPAPLVAAATLPLHAADSVVNFRRRSGQGSDLDRRRAREHGGPSRGHRGGPGPARRTGDGDDTPGADRSLPQGCRDGQVQDPGRCPEGDARQHGPGPDGEGGLRPGRGRAEGRVRRRDQARPGRQVRRGGGDRRGTVRRRPRRGRPGDEGGRGGEQGGPGPEPG